MKVTNSDTSGIEIMTMGWYWIRAIRVAKITEYWWGPDTNGMGARGAAQIAITPTRPTIYRYVGPDGKIREYGRRVPGRKE